LRTLIDDYDGDRMAVGEVYLLDTADVATYYGDHDELHLNFNFPPLFTAWDAAKWAKQIDRAERELNPIDAWPTWVLSNHDNRRHATRYGASEARSRAAAVLLLTLRGTPFLYAGEELGLEDAVIPDDRVVDPGGRDGCRGPIPWDPSPEHGWGTTDPWLPWPPDSATRNAQTQLGDAGSIAHLYRRVLAERRASAGLRLGGYEPIDGPDGVLVYRRATSSDERMVAINFTAQAVALPLSGTIAVSTAPDRDASAFDGILGPDEAVILQPG